MSGRCNLDRAYKNPKMMADVVKEVFHKVAVTTHPRKQTPVIRQQDTERILEALGTQLGLSPKMWGDVGGNQMFWRFDFDGDGFLDETEVSKLCISMVRRFHDATSPPEPGIVKLGGSIPFRGVDVEYNVEKKLGQGGQGAVYLATSKSSDRKVVVKFYDKSCPNAPVDDITDEFELMMKLRHPRIANYFDIFQDHANIYVVTEPYFGGDLTGAVKKAAEHGAKLNEVWMAFVYAQIVQGIGYLHNNEIMHCDLKEANVMITSNTNWQEPTIVVIDFGLSNSFVCGTRPSGTPGYMPPEVWKTGLWTPRGDIFSMGVMLYRMRAGEGPFTSGCKDLKEIKNKTLNCEAQLAAGSQLLRGLVGKMLGKEFTARPTIAMVHDNDWFRKQETTLVDSKILDAIHQQQKANDFQRAMLADFAARQNVAELRSLNELFMNLDVNNNGYLDEHEIRSGLQGKWPTKQIDSLISLMLANGQVSYQEFLGQLIAAKAPEENEFLAKVFHEMDTAGKGFLDMESISELLQRPAVGKILGKREPMMVLQSMDTDKDGKISFHEFRAVMQRRRGFDHGAPHHGSHCPPKRMCAGQKVMFYSTSHEVWISCIITKVDERAGAIQIDSKPGYYFRGEELRKRIRFP